MPSGPTIILGLKIAVVAVTLILVASGWAIATGRRRLHGRLNITFFTLTVLAVCAFEGFLQAGAPVTAHFTPADKVALRIHLCFVIPLLPVMIVMLITGLKRRRRIHLPLSVLFLALWTGMLITGVFFLPHSR